MRKIPSVMATQHPDNAFAPYWDAKGTGFVNSFAELDEAVNCFKDLGVDEYMWDWEGKHADAAVIDKLLSQHHDFFKRHHLARDIFLTFRLPNIWTEKGYSLIQAMTAILIAEDFAKDLGFRDRPLFEVILPMTERAEQLIKMQEMFESLANFKAKNFSHTSSQNTKYLELIPLIEAVDSQLAVGALLEKYLKLHKKRFDNRPEYLRVFLARSDPAMASGMLATVLANKLALSQLAEFERRHNLPIFPIAGVGSLPFRGGLTPALAADYAKDNPGFRTVTVQSSFRYDYSPRQVQTAVGHLLKTLPQNRMQAVEESSIRDLRKIIAASSDFYQSTLKAVAGDLAPVFQSVPRRRERRLHIGLLAYQRSVGNQSLPRAITFTGGFYSVGVPPEFIGLGRTLAGLSVLELKKLLKIYPALPKDLERAGRYLNKDNLKLLAGRNHAWRGVQQDVEAVEAKFGLRLGPRSYDEKAHKNLTASVLIAKNPGTLTGLIEQLAKLRKSLG